VGSGDNSRVTSMAKSCEPTDNTIRSDRHDVQVGGLSAADLSLLALGALLIGFAKTAIGGVSSISIALFAAVLPARESTGAVLPLLIAGDVFALQAYRAHAQWARLIRLFPSVAVGVVAGAVFVSLVDDTVMRRTIGAVLLGLVLLTVWRRRTGSHDGAVSGPTGAAGGGWPAALGYGSLAGFTTMVANAAGAVMSLYLLTARLDKLAFLGTAAWFFFPRQRLQGAVQYRARPPDSGLAEVERRPGARGTRRRPRRQGRGPSGEPGHVRAAGHRVHHTREHQLVAVSRRAHVEVAQLRYRTPPWPDGLLAM
jgi:uncharacterized membrane protein YfcA